MVREKPSMKSRIGWLAMHGGFLAWGVCLIVLAEEHRDGVARKAATAEKPSDSAFGERTTKKSADWLEAQIAGLGNSNYGIRAKATRQLLAASSEAVDPLLMALNSSDPEVARRSRFIVSQLLRSDEACLLALEHIARLPHHPAAQLAKAMHESELARRERLQIAQAEHRQLEAQSQTRRLLHEARVDLRNRRFAEARQKTAAASALNSTYDLFDDRPELVLTAIEQAEIRADAPPMTAERN